MNTNLPKWMQHQGGALPHPTPEQVQADKDSRANRSESEKDAEFEAIMNHYAQAAGFDSWEDQALSQAWATKRGGVWDYLKTRDYSKVYQIVTNLLSGVAVLTIAYLTTQNLTPMFNAGNIPVIIVGMFPILASFGMFLGVLISEPMSLLRVLYLFGMFATLVLGV